MPWSEATSGTVPAVLAAWGLAESPRPAQIPSGLNRVLDPGDGVGLDIQERTHFGLDGEALFLAAGVDADRNRLGRAILPVEQLDVEHTLVKPPQRSPLTGQAPALLPDGRA